MAETGAVENGAAGQRRLGAAWMGCDVLRRRTGDEAGTRHQPQALSVTTIDSHHSEIQRAPDDRMAWGAADEIIAQRGKILLVEHQTDATRHMSGQGPNAAIIGIRVITTLHRQNCQAQQIAALGNLRRTLEGSQHLRPAMVAQPDHRRCIVQQQMAVIRILHPPALHQAGNIRRRPTLGPVQHDALRDDGPRPGRLPEQPRRAQRQNERSGGGGAVRVTRNAGTQRLQADLSGQMQRGAQFGQQRRGDAVFVEDHAAGGARRLVLLAA